MGSSNTGVVTIGDIEDQRHNPKWFVDHKHMLRPNQEDDANKLKYSILKVPEIWRQPSEDFSPELWHFGLHNRENLDINGSEGVKLGIAVQYGLVGEKWVQFCNEIVDDPKAMLACYGLQHGLTNWTDEQVKHVLALDALLLAHYFDKSCLERQLLTCKALPAWSNENHVYHIPNYNLMGSVHSDLRRVENQIPLVLIDKVVKYLNNSIASQTSESHEPGVDDLISQQRSLSVGVYAILLDSFLEETVDACQHIDCIDDALRHMGNDEADDALERTDNDEADDALERTDNDKADDALESTCNQSSVFDEKTQIFEAAYKFMCGHEGLQRQRKQSLFKNTYIHVPSATKLEQSGIIIIGVDGPLCKMTYNEKCLYLPKVKMNADTRALIRNMVWYESQSISDGCLFTDYYVLMRNLIQAPEDWDLLIKYGVILGGSGSGGFENWRASREAIIILFPSSQIHHEMKEEIMLRYNHRRYRLWSEFNIVFCSKPWIVLSTIAVVLVTLSTLVQTYISIIGSNKMKPKFP